MSAISDQVEAASGPKHSLAWRELIAIVIPYSSRSVRRGGSPHYFPLMISTAYLSLEQKFGLGQDRHTRRDQLHRPNHKCKRTKLFYGTCCCVVLIWPSTVAGRVSRGIHEIPARLIKWGGHIQTTPPFHLIGGIRGSRDSQSLFGQLVLSVFNGDWPWPHRSRAWFNLSAVDVDMFIWASGACCAWKMPVQMGPFARDGC